MIIIFSYSVIFFQNIDTILFDFIKSTLLNSLLITFLLTLFHIFFALKEGVRNNFSTNQKLVIKEDLELDDLELKVNKLTNWTLIDKKVNFIKFKSSITLKSFGEIITVFNENGKTTMTSKPLFILTIFDFGKNFENIKLIKQAIELKEKV